MYDSGILHVQDKLSMSAICVAELVVSSLLNSKFSYVVEANYCHCMLLGDDIQGTAPASVINGFFF